MVDTCPVCLNEDRAVWALGVCGHRVCSPCMGTIVADTMGRLVLCPLCRGVVMWWMKDGVPVWLFTEGCIDAAFIQAAGGPKWITQLGKAACESTIMSDAVIQNYIAWFAVSYISRQPWKEHLDSFLGWVRTALETHMDSNMLCGKLVACLMNSAQQESNCESLVHLEDLVRRVLLRHGDYLDVVKTCLGYYSNMAGKPAGVELLLAMALEKARWLVSVVQRYEATPAIMSMFVEGMVKKLCSRKTPAALDTSAALCVFITFVLDRMVACFSDKTLHVSMEMLVRLAEDSANRPWFMHHVVSVVKVMLKGSKDVLVVLPGLHFVYWMAYHGRFAKVSQILLADMVLPVVWVFMKTWKTNEEVVKFCVGIVNCLQFELPAVQDIIWQPSHVKTLRKALERFGSDDVCICKQCTEIFGRCSYKDVALAAQAFNAMRTALVLHGEDKEVVENSLLYFAGMSYEKSGVALEKLWEVEPLMYAAVTKQDNQVEYVIRSLIFYYNLAVLDVAKRPMLAGKLPWVYDMLHRFVACRRGDLYWRFIAKVMTPPNWPTLLSLFSVTMATPGVGLDTVRYAVKCVEQFAAADIDAGSDIYALLWQGVLPWLKSAVCRHGAVCVELVDACMSIAFRVTKPTLPWPEKYVLLVLDLVQACVTAQRADTEVAEQCAECLHSVLTTHQHWADSAPLTAVLRQLQAEHGDVAAVVDVCVLISDMRDPEDGFARPRKQVKVA